MSAIKLNSSGGGSITISPASTASTLTLTAPAQTGTIGLDGPAFSAYGTGAQNFTNSAWSKVAYNTKDYDTATCFSTANNRFTPNVAGYYQISASMFFSNNASGIGIMAIYKNGNFSMYGTGIPMSVAPILTVSGLVYLNGTTDYVEIYGVQTSGVTVTGGTNVNSLNFQGCLIRGAA